MARAERRFDRCTLSELAFQIRHFVKTRREDLSEPMENLTDTLKKAFYLGVGLASYAGEQVGDIQGKAQSLADDLIRRGEDTTEEASKFFNTWVAPAQSDAESPTDADKPQKIEILSIEDVDSDGDSESL
ncbi:hypothetical protein [Altericista sp. CCNU0014]|uniref:hypothetical protein n=1 Tax=Altericista sp. CCNU0014 TaxID=3082949 RepID=UPI00384E90C6